ncbi:MAG: cytochrome C oxidase Cbb3 [Planctomycetota bacterium]|nr:MAG: cytochrome C oxidase Cbb3 [Planctomycetota bacterium]
MSNEVLSGHSYDGIEEYDNPLPGWWKWTFVATIVFSVFYWMYYHSGAPGRSIYDKYDKELAEVTRLQFKEIGELKPDEATILKYMQNESWLKVGQVVFKTHCVSCHGRDGEGKVGPNLTDDAYKHVRNLEDIARVVRDGANAGAMPAWGNRLHINEIVLVSAYVASLRGKNVSGGKAPEGNPIPPWPTATEAQEESADEQGKGAEHVRGS